MSWRYAFYAFLLTIISMKINWSIEHWAFWLFSLWDSNKSDYLCNTNATNKAHNNCQVLLQRPFFPFSDFNFFNSFAVHGNWFVLRIHSMELNDDQTPSLVLDFHFRCYVCALHRKYSSTVLGYYFSFLIGRIFIPLIKVRNGFAKQMVVRHRNQF